MAIGTLLASGIFAVAPYVGFLAPVAALSLGLPFIIGGAIFSVAVIALSAVVINKNNNISEKDAVVQAQEQRISEQKTRLAEKNTELFDKQEQLPKEGLDYLDLAVPFNKQKQQANGLDYLDLATSKDLNRLNVEIPSPKSQPTKPEDKDIFHDAEPGEEKNTENHSPKSQPAKEENSQGWKIFGIMAGIMARVKTTAVALKDGYDDYCAKSNTPTKLDEVKASSMNNGACLGLQM